MKSPKNLLYTWILLIAVVNVSCKKDSEQPQPTPIVATSFQGVFSEEIGVVELVSGSQGVEATVNWNGAVTELVTNSVWERGADVSLSEGDIQLFLHAHEDGTLDVQLDYSNHQYQVIGFNERNSKAYMGVVDENIDGTMQLGLFNFVVKDQGVNGLMYFEALDVEPTFIEGTVLNSTNTQMLLEITRNGAAEQVVVELVESFGKTSSGGLIVTAVPVTIATSNVGPGVNSGTMIIGFSASFLPPYDTVEISQGKLTSIPSYFNDASGRFHKLSFASPSTQWSGTSFVGGGSYLDLIFAASATQIGNITAVYPTWNWSSAGTLNKLLVADYEVDSLYVQENLTKATDFVYESISVAQLDISRNGLIYTISGEFQFGYPMDVNGNLLGNPGRMAHFSYTGTLDSY